MDERHATRDVKTRWYSGNRESKVIFESPHSRNEIAKRLRVFRGTVVSGGQPYHDWQVIASHDARGFYVSMRGAFLIRGDMTALLPLTATCRWIPTNSGSVFEATIVPSLCGRTFVARIVVVVALTIGFSFILGSIGFSFAGLLATFVGINTFWLLGLIGLRNPMDHDVEQCETMIRFFRETLDAVMVEP